MTVQLREEFERDVPAKLDGVYRKLLLEAFHDVNWDEIAEDLVER